MRSVKQQKAVVVGHLGAISIVRVRFVGINQLVIRLLGAEAVVINLHELVFVGKRLARFVHGVAAIKEAVAVPSGTGEFGPSDGVFQQLVVFQIFHADGAPVGAAFRDFVGQVAAIFGKSNAADGGGAVLGKGIGVQNDAGLAVEVVLHIKDGLVLESVVFKIIILAAFFGGGGILLVIPQFLQPVADVLAETDGFQVFEGLVVLHFHPLLGGGSVGIFQPTPWVFHGGAKINVGSPLWGTFATRLQ